MTSVRFDLPSYETESINGGIARSEVYAASCRESVKDSVTGGDSDEAVHVTEIAGRESHQVRRLRIVVMLVLLTAAVAVSASIFYLTKRAQEEEFEAEFNGVAAKVLESFTEIVGEKVSSVSSMAVAATSYAHANNMTWPLVSLNDFAVRAESVMTLADCLLLEVMPLVTDALRAEWERYSTANIGWMTESMERYSTANKAWMAESLETQSNTMDAASANLPFIFQFTETGVAADPGPGPYTPIWQHSPAIPTFMVNLNTLSYLPYQKAISSALDTGRISLGGVFRGNPGPTDSPDITTAFYATLFSLREGRPVVYQGEPMSFFAYPIFDTHDQETRQVVGTLGVVVNWASYFKGVVPPEAAHVTVVLENECDGAFTFSVDNDEVIFEGAGDLHDTEYDHLMRKAALDSLYSTNKPEHALELDELNCPFQLLVYPTKEMQEENETRIPFITTLAVALVFLFTAAVFVVYNRLVERRQSIVLNQATQSTAIVSSFLPEDVQRRLLGADTDDKGTGEYNSPMKRLKTFLAEGEDQGNAKPIADLFPYCTVLFADIAGFTAWASTREPSQVFVLLQTVYKAFDLLAKKHKVFKVETIGDSYVAVTGIPNEQKKHAVLITRFAADCLEKFNELVHQLEVQLGPDTADLGMRIGLHSGPVTAGVLRGDRPRFQLFGDTVNTAARMESTSQSGRVQISHTTALELQKARKAHWIKRREDAVEAKGKGVMETYWLTLKSAINEQAPGFNDDCSGELLAESPIPGMDQSQVLKRNRLIEWCVELLSDHLRKVTARRQGLFLASTTTYSSLIYKKEEGKTCLDELKDTMSMQKYDHKAASLLANADHRKVELSDSVVDQLREYVSIIAGAYQPNSFHNFEHASHVVMSVDKFLKRIVAPDMDKGGHKALHEYTHGLTSEPLVLLSIVWSAFIHDVDHRGVSNMQLAKEEQQMAQAYHNKSIAEQNSVDISWDLLMKPEFNELRRAMFTDRDDVLRFREVIVRIVLATDIFDKELNDLRKQRWNKAFGSSSSSGANNNDDLRATIVMEHIIQASDVAHTMQHWHVYRKWNQRLFLEMHAAYKAGRMEKNPVDFWYQGEIGFFDNYIIPLAKKLKDCNVFGVSSDECLNYAMQNRREWEQRGQQVLEELKELVAEEEEEEEEED